MSEDGERDKRMEHRGSKGARRGARGSGGKPIQGALRARRLPSGEFEFVHPRCVLERRDDYEEGLEIWKQGEPEEAIEVLRFALEGCGDNLWIHVALGRIALEAEGDATLARGHFGYAFELARRSLPPDFQGPLPRGLTANRPVYDAIEGLAESLVRLGQTDEAGRLRQLAVRWSGERSRRD